MYAHRPDRLFVVFAVHCVELGDLTFFRMVGLDGADAGKHLVHPRKHIGDPRETAFVVFPNHPADQLERNYQQQQPRNQRDDQRIAVELTTGDDDRRQTAQHLQRSIGEILHGVRHRIFQRRSVVGAAADEVSDVHVTVETQRLLGELTEDRTAHIGHHADANIAGAVSVQVDPQTAQ